MIVLVNQTVADFTAFKNAFVSEQTSRKANGIRGHRVAAVLGRPGAIVIEFEVADAFKASRYFESGEFRAAMLRAGGLGEPELLWAAPVDVPQAASAVRDSDDRAAA